MRFPLWWLCFLLFAGAGWAQRIDPALLRMDLEELMAFEVTSAARHPQKFFETPAAIYVIPGEELRDSFSDLLPEILREVPGVHVARITASDWAVSIRGFNDRFANKLLVLMDGRSLYTPLFSGVFWERQDMVVEDLDRIEVVRGPGGSLWGANAVNGVINVISKSAWETQGLLTSLKVGDEQTLASIRYGGHHGSLAYRVYLRAHEDDSLAQAHGGQAADDWRMLQGGFRLDWNLAEGLSLRLSGDAYTQTAGVIQGRYTPSPPYEVFSPDDGYGSGGNLLLRLEGRGERDSWYFQGYYDASTATGFPLVNWDLEVYDLEFQHHRHGERLLWTWGFGYRLYDTEVKGSPAYAFHPADTRTYILNAFGQAEFQVLPDLRLVLGSKVELHEETGLNLQPTARFLWRLSARRVLWGAVSRAVRTPSLAELDAVINLYAAQVEGLPLFLELDGDDDLDPETLVAFELGYREQVSPGLHYDLTLFFHRYDDLVSLPAPGEPPELWTEPWPHLHATTRARNMLDGETYGLELAALWRPCPRSFLRLSYSYLKMFLHAPEETIWFGEEQEDQWPRHLLTLRAGYHLPGNWYFDMRMRYVSRIASYGVPSYVATDLKLTWRPRRDLSLSFVGENVFDPGHPEFGQGYALRTPLREVERSFFLKVTWRR